ADRSILLVEQDLSRERVELEGEITGKSLLDAQQKLPGAIAAALVRGQKRPTNTDRVVTKQAPIVGIEPAQQTPAEAQQRHLHRLCRHFCRSRDNFHQSFVLLQSLHWNRNLGGKPAAVAVTRRV